MSESNETSIALLLNGSERYGVGQSIETLAAELARIGRPFMLISVAPGPGVDRLESLGHRVTVIGDKPIPPIVGKNLYARSAQASKGVEARAKLVAKLVRALESAHALAVYVRWPTLMPLAGAAARQLGGRAYWHMPNVVGRTLPLGLNKWLLQLTCWRHKVLPMANSRFTAATLGSWPVTPEVLYVGSDTRRFNPDAVVFRERKEVAVDSSALVVGVAGRLVRSKGQDRLLEALLRVDHPLASRLTLLCLGGPAEGEYADRLRDIAARAGASDRLVLAGHVDDVPSWYGMVDVAVNARIDAEPYGQSVVEAMMMRRPVLAHAFGGPAETVVDGTTGWHSPSTEVADWTEALKRVLDDQPRWVEMGNAARKRALAYFSAEAFRDRLLTFIDADSGRG